MRSQGSTRPRGADVVVRSLAAAGVRTVFTLSGNQIMPVFDACLDADIRLVHVRHEAAAVYMAEAWAQLTGEVGVALLTAGPGFANGLSALYTARASESPVVLLGGDAPAGEAGLGAFQEMAQAEAARPMAKAAWTARSVGEMGFDVARAVRTARSGRPGPVHLALPFDLLMVVDERAAVPPEDAFRAEPLDLPEGSADAILAALAGAERPLVLTGPSLNPSRARSVVDGLSEAVGAPVIAQESPRGLRDACLGAFAEVLAEADTILLLGKRVDFALRFGRPPAVNERCRFLAVDPDADALERARRALGVRLVAAFQADAHAAAEHLAARAAASRAGQADGWARQVREAIGLRPAAWSAPSRPASAPAMRPVEVCRAVQPVLDASPASVLVADGGEFGQWAQACLRAPRRIINGPSGAIGGSIPYAVAARLASPDGGPVVAVLGDGTAGFHLSELDTAVRYGLPLVAVIGNDARWNAEHLIQLREFGADRLVGCGLNRTRYDLVAAGFGCHGEHVRTAAELGPALGRALDAGRPACVNVEIEGVPAPVVTRADA